MLIQGRNLSDGQRREVLSAFPYRWTVENHARALRLHGDAHPTVGVITDQQWLERYAFHFTADGSRLMRNRYWCEPVLGDTYRG